MTLSKKSWILIGLAAALLGAGAAGAGWVLHKRRSGTRVLSADEAFALGRQLLEARRYADAYARLAYAADRQPGHLDAQALSGRAARQLGRRDVAFRHFKAAWDGGRRTREILAPMADCASFKSPDERLRATLAWAGELPAGAERTEIERDFHFAAGQASKALALWTEAQKAAPSARLLSKVAVGYAALKQAAAAEAALEPHRRTPLLDDEGYVLLASLKAEREDLSAAEDVFDEGRRLHPASEPLPIHQAILRLSDDRPAEAVALLDPLKARAEDPEVEARRRSARLFLAFAYAARGEAAALAALEDAAQGDTPAIEGERIFYGALRKGAERKAADPELLPKARKLLGPHPVLEWTFARSCVGSGRWADAVAAYRNVSGLLARAPLLSYELAQALRGQGRPDEALDTLRRLHRRGRFSKASVELYRNLAAERGLPKEAAEAQAFLEERFKDDFGVAFAGGALALASGRLEDAARAFDALAARSPDSAPVEVAQLAVLMAKKDYEGVLREAAGSRAPAPAVAHYRAAALAGLHRMDEAEEALARATAEHAVPPLLLAHANLLLGRGKLEAAARRYADVLRLQPKSDVARLGLGLIATRSGRWTEALEQLRPLIEAGTSHPLAYLAAGEAELGLRRPDRALASAVRALALAPENAGAALLQAAALLAQGKAGEAEPILRAVAEKRPEDAAAQALLARARLARGAAAEALQGLDTALARAPAGDVSLRQLRLVVLAQAGRGLEARQALERLRPLLPDDEGRLLEAWLLQREGQAGRAIDLLRPHLRHRATALLWAELMIDEGRVEGVVEALDPHAPDAAVWSRLADRARARAGAAAVVALCRRALKGDPENPALLNNLAWFLLQLPSFEKNEALSAARKATSLLPANPSILHTYGTVLVRCDKPRDCIDLLTRAERATEGSPALMLLLSTAYHALGNAEQAARWTRACLSHPGTAAVEKGELSRPALEERLRTLKAQEPPR